MENDEYILTRREKDHQAIFQEIKPKKQGFFDNEKEITKDDKYLFIPSYYNTRWSQDLNTSLMKYFNFFPAKEYTKLNSDDPMHDNRYNGYYTSYLQYGRHTYLYYYENYDNFKKCKNIIFQNIVEDSDHRFFKMFGCNVYGFLHSFTDLSIDPTKKDKWEEFVIENSKGIFVCSEYFKRICVEKGYDGNKIHAIGYPFKRIENISFENRRNILIFNHRFVKEKGAELFITEVIPKLLNKYDDLEIYVFIPPSGFHTVYINQIQKIDHPKLFVYVNQNPLYEKVLKEAKFGLSLSNFDTFGTAFGHGLTNGLFYFVPNKFAFPEIAPPEMIYNDLNEFYDKFDYYYRNYDEIKNRMSIFIENFYERFDEKHIIDKIKKVLK